MSGNDISRRSFIREAAIAGLSGAAVASGALAAYAADGSAVSGSASGSTAGSASGSAAGSTSGSASASASGSAAGSGSGAGSASGSASGSTPGSGSGSAASAEPSATEAAVVAKYGSNESVAGASWLGEAPVIDASKIAQTYDTDLLVVGGGQAGIPAARKAAELGMKVMVMESQSEENWTCNGCDMGTVNAQAYLDTGSPEVDEMAVINEWQLRSYCRSMPSMAKLYATRSGECADFIRSVVPQDKLDEYSVYYGFPDGRDSIQVDHSGYTSFPGTISYRDFDNTLGGGQNEPAFYDVLKYSIQAAEDAGAQWIWGTKAVVLVQNDDGDVTGCIGEAEDGYVQVNAKAVLMTCGDFSGNGEMVLSLFDEVREIAEVTGIDGSDPSMFASMGRDGSGIKMMCWAGAMMEPGPRAAQNISNGMGAPTLTAVGNYPVFGPDGKRFYNDAQLQFGGLGFFFRRWPGELMCSIADGKWADNIRKQGYEHNMSSTTCHREWDLVTDQLNNMTTGPDGFQVYGFTGYGMGLSTMYAADTLDELADIFGYTGDAKQGLLDEIAHYNDMCAAGKDTDWGRDADLMYPLDTPPFFGVSTTTSKGSIRTGLVQMSGVMVNDNFQVRRADETIIKGLYAAGNDCGGRYAIQYHTLMAGNSLAMAATQGMVTAEHIATSLDADLEYADKQDAIVAALAEAAANSSAPKM